MDKEQPKLGINLLVRNLENHLNMILNDYCEVPIEMQRIVVGNIYEKLTNAADKVTRQELIEYESAVKKFEEQEKQPMEE